MKKILLILSGILCFIPCALADKYAPEFGSMKIYRCEISETIYNQDGTTVSTTGYHRDFRFDDTDNVVYLQKEPLSNIRYFGNDKVEFAQESVTDFYIMQSRVTIDRINNTYNSVSSLQYDFPEFMQRNAKASGTCKFIN